MKVLILGSTGLIGSNILRYFASDSDIQVLSTYRKFSQKNFFESLNVQSIYFNDFSSKSKIINLLNIHKPNFIINAIGITKHIKKFNFQKMFYLNSVLPCILDELSLKLNFKFFHISTDCVFSGIKGSYIEDDLSDAIDIYGKTKSIADYYIKNSPIFRISTIGHESFTPFNGLLNWFLNQKNSCYGFTNAFFSGITTIEFAKILKHLLSVDLQNEIYHISSERISKYNLLKIIRDVYKKKIDILPSNNFIIDRSLNSTKFKSKFNIKVNNWEKMLVEQNEFYQKSKKYIFK